MEDIDIANTATLILVRCGTIQSVRFQHHIKSVTTSVADPRPVGGREPQMECSDGRPAPTLLKKKKRKQRYIAENNIIRQQWWGFIDAVSITYLGGHYLINDPIR